MFLGFGRECFDELFFLQAAETFDLVFSLCGHRAGVQLFVIHELHWSAATGIFSSFVCVIVFVDSLCQVCGDPGIQALISATKEIDKPRGIFFDHVFIKKSESRLIC